MNLKIYEKLLAEHLVPEPLLLSLSPILTNVWLYKKQVLVLYPQNLKNCQYWSLGMSSESHTLALGVDTGQGDSLESETRPKEKSEVSRAPKVRNLEFTKQENKSESKDSPALSPIFCQTNMQRITPNQMDQDWM